MIIQIVKGVECNENGENVSIIAVDIAHKHFYLVFEFLMGSNQFLRTW